MMHELVTISHELKSCQSMEILTSLIQLYQSCLTSSLEMSGVLPFLISVSGVIPISAYKSNAVDDRMWLGDSAQESHRGMGVDFFTMLRFTALLSFSDPALLQQDFGMGCMAHTLSSGHRIHQTSYASVPSFLPWLDWI